MGVAQSAVSEWELGHYLPKARRLPSADSGAVRSIADYESGVRIFGSQDGRWPAIAVRQLCWYSFAAKDSHGIRQNLTQPLQNCGGANLRIRLKYNYIT